MLRAYQIRSVANARQTMPAAQLAAFERIARRDGNAVAPAAINDRRRLARGTGRSKRLASHFRHVAVCEGALLKPARVPSAVFPQSAAIGPGGGNRSSPMALVPAARGNLTRAAFGLARAAFGQAFGRIDSAGCFAALPPHAARVSAKSVVCVRVYFRLNLSRPTAMGSPTAISTP